MFEQWLRRLKLSSWGVVAAAFLSGAVVWEHWLTPGPDISAMAVVWVVVAMAAATGLVHMQTEERNV